MKKNHYRRRKPRDYAPHTEIDRTARARRILRKNILDRMPDRIPDLYPAARELHRRFVLHIGPTNSGKTHEAMEAARAAGNGIYLGPLRLLAYEQYDRLNRDGYPCDLVTGEEEIYVEGASYRASTVEMLPPETYYDVAVIDEAQMVSDRQRGGAWTAAILGVLAKEVHVCLAPEAEECVIRLIRDCGDEYRTVRHERMTPLVADTHSYSFPKSVEPGDALIVFSRKDVHAVAAILQESRRISCSVIYGALPYDVRHKQAEDFASGRSGVVVATDAIGMGLNLPIRRVVFLQTEKFDGTERRELTPPEVKQIAGRAGRYGIHETGYYNTIRSKSFLIGAMEEEPVPVAAAFVSFPETLIGLGDKLSATMVQWIAIPSAPGYEKADITEELKLCLIAEERTEDRRLIYRFATMPFDSEDEYLMLLWMEMLECQVQGRKLDYSEARLAGLGAETGAEGYFKTRYSGYSPPGGSGGGPVRGKEDEDADMLAVLERQFAVCDLLYYYRTRFEPEEFSWVLPAKNRISERIIAILDKQSLKPRTCRYCGKKLPWDSRYGICRKCYERGLRRWRR